MAIFTFFNQPKARQFQYRPRYYDPVAEAREKRKQEVLGPNYSDNYKAAGEKTEEEYKPGQYLEEVRQRRGILTDRRRSRKKTSTIISIALLAGLIYFTWWIIKTTILVQ